MKLRPATCAVAVPSLLALVLAAPAHAGSPGVARPDTYSVGAAKTLVVGGSGVFGNDAGGADTVVRHTDPGHGTLSLAPDGSLRYTPADGFTGTDTFTYTTTPAVHLYRTALPPLATVGGVAISGGAYGSALTAKPGSSDVFYGLTDRGPNVDGPDGTKVEPLPDFTPAIGEFRLRDGRATLVHRIPLRAGDGTPYDGQVNCTVGTGETITDLNGNTLPCSDTGYDPEGLVALPDGTFWVSDEYGPLITHFDRSGRALERFSPFDRSLPRELGYRVPNKGMEGLTVTPDGRTLVGIMQSALQAPDLGDTKASKVAPVRIVTVDLRTHVLHEYLYLLHDPDDNSGAVSEITAIDNHTFVVDERDGNVEPDAYKKLFRIDLRDATDIGPAASVPGAGYDPTKGGLLVGTAQQSIEAYVGKADTVDATALLASAGITPASSQLDLDLGGLVSTLDPSGAFFGHDKIEGVAALNKGRTLVISNDSDFGISGLVNDAPPFQLEPKIAPNGQQDDGEYLSVDRDRIDKAPSTATVTITVR